MGSTLGPLMANAFMCSIKEKLEHENSFPPFHRRRVDDSFVLVCDFSAADFSITTLNKADPIINITIRQRTGYPSLK